MDENLHVDVSEQAIPLSQTEERDLLELVEEKQRSRGIQALTPDQVPMVLLPYQARWHADNSTVRLGEKSRRIGFSWGCHAAEGALEASRPGTKGMDQFYMGYNLGMAAENIGDVATFARAYGLAVSEISVRRHRESVVVTDSSGAVLRNEKKDITTYKVVFSSGHVYEALSSNPHNWRGRQGHARIDEAAFHPNLQEVVKAALAFRLWGGRISITSTHNGDDNQFNLWVRDIKAGKLNWSLHRETFDDALREGFYRRVCLVRGIEWTAEGEAAYRAEAYADYPEQADADEELSVIPKKGSGAYFSRMLIEQCQDSTIPIVRWQKEADWVTNPNRLREASQWCDEVLKPLLDQMPKDRRTAYGQDFGRSGDLSVMVPGQNDGGTKWRVPFVAELRNIPFDVQQLVMFFILDRLPLLQNAWFDSRGNGQSHAEAALQRYGASRVLMVMLTAAWYGEHFPPYKAAYEDKTIIAPPGEDWIADHRRVVLKRGVPGIDDGHDKGSDGGQRHGDAAVGGVLMYGAARSKFTLIEYTSAPDKASRWDSDSDADTEFNQFEGAL